MSADSARPRVRQRGGASLQYGVHIRVCLRYFDLSLGRFLRLVDFEALCDRLRRRLRVLLDAEILLRRRKYRLL